MKEKKNHKTNKRIIWLILKTVCIYTVIVLLSSCRTSVSITQETPLPTEDSAIVTTGTTESETLSEEKRNQEIRVIIDKTVLDWIEGRITFEDASVILVNIQKTRNEELACYAKEQLDFITIENCKCKLDTRMNKNCSA